MSGRDTLIGAAAAVARLPAWDAVPDRDAIHRHYHFQDFNEAFAFMTRVAHEAERLDHHPEWSNSYNQVEVTLTTHSSGGVTARDLALARFMDAAAVER